MKSNLIDLDQLVAKANELPALPQSTVRLAGLLGSAQDLDLISKIVEVVTFDPALTFKLIRAANSAFSGSSQPVTNVREAVMRLGTAQVFAIAVANSVRPHMQTNLPEYGFSEGAFWRHSVIAAVATEVAQPHCTVTIPPETFTAALLHDMGKLIIARFLSPEILELLHQARTNGQLDPLQAEISILSVHHGELGGLVAQHWQFPERIIKGIIYHHNPEAGDDLICYFVWLANAVAKKMEAELAGKELSIDPRSDVLEKIGLPRSSLDQFCTDASRRFEQVRSRYNVK